MELLYLFERLRTSVLDTFFAALTYLGDEACFIAIVLVLYWCVDKMTAYYLSAIGFCGTACNQILKMIFRIPRPWVLDPEFTIVEQAREGATGYSFPSGHTQNAVGIYGGLAVTRQHWWARVLALLPVILVPVSRMYLGVHTPLDVGVSVLLAVLLIVLLRPLAVRAAENTKALVLLLTPAVLLGIVSILYLQLYPFPADVDPEHLQSAMANAWKLTGAAAAMLAAGLIDRQYLHFDTHAPLVGQVLKAVIGIALVLGLKAGLKVVLYAVMPQYPADFVRYFLIVLAAATLWPMTFPFFAKLGRKKKDT